jgi:hypothetical protein
MHQGRIVKFNHVYLSEFFTCVDVQRNIRQFLILLPVGPPFFTSSVMAFMTIIYLMSGLISIILSVNKANNYTTGTIKHNSQLLFYSPIAPNCTKYQLFFPIKTIEIHFTPTRNSIFFTFF